MVILYVKFARSTPKPLYEKQIFCTTQSCMDPGNVNHFDKYTHTKKTIAMARNIFHRTMSRAAQISGTKRTHDGNAVYEPITAKLSATPMLIPFARGVIGNS